MTASAQSAAGPIRRLFGSAANALATLLELGRTRLELATVEIQLEIRRVAEIVLWLTVALHAAIVALFMLGFWIIVLFWDSHRLLAVGLVAGFFALLALFAGLMVAFRIRTRPPLLQGTLAELQRDMGRLRGQR